MLVLEVAPVFAYMIFFASFKCQDLLQYSQFNMYQLIWSKHAAGSGVTKYFDWELLPSSLQLLLIEVVGAFWPLKGPISPALETSIFGTSHFP